MLKQVTFLPTKSSLCSFCNSAENDVTHVEFFKLAIYNSLLKQSNFLIYEAIAEEDSMTNKISWAN